MGPVSGLVVLEKGRRRRCAPLGTGGRPAWTPWPADVLLGVGSTRTNSADERSSPELVRLYRTNYHDDRSSPELVRLYRTNYHDDGSSPELVRVVARVTASSAWQRAAPIDDHGPLPATSRGPANSASVSMPGRCRL